MQDRPTAEDLLEAVREHLVEVRDALDGRLAFHARVAANVVGIVLRELADGPRFAAAERARAAALLGRDDDARVLEAELARQVRDGSLDDRWNEVVAHVRATVREKLLIANPGHLDPDARGRA